MHPKLRNISLSDVIHAIQETIINAFVFVEITFQCDILYGDYMSLNSIDVGPTFCKTI